MRKLSAKCVPKCLNEDQKRQRCQLSKQILEFFRGDPNDFLSGAIGDHGRNLVISQWLEIKRQTMEWRHNGSPRPKNFRVQKSAGKFSPRIFGIKTASSSLIIFQMAKLSTRSITHLCWCNWRTFWRKNAHRGKVTKGVLFLHDNAPAHRALAT